MRIDRAPNVFAVWDRNHDGTLSSCRELWRVPHHDGTPIANAKQLVDILEMKDVGQERIQEMEKAASDWRQETAGFEPPTFFERLGNFMAGLVLMPLALAFFFVTTPYTLIVRAIPNLIGELTGDRESTRRHMKPFLAPLAFSAERFALAFVSSEPPGAAVVRDSSDYTLPFINQEIIDCSKTDDVGDDSGD